jgi:murein peptide amidase A
VEGACAPSTVVRPRHTGSVVRTRSRQLLALATLAAVTLAGSPGAPAAARDVGLLGRSWQGRPIRVVEVGSPHGTPVLVVGCIHGNEPAGIAVARALERLSPPGLDLWIVPDLNPDGVAADTRGNAHGVDLNRNFPFRWRPRTGVYQSGPRPLSEREARIAYRLIRRLHPRVTIWFHQHLDLVWASGGNRRVERVFAQVSGLPYHPLPALGGSAIDWQNHALPGTTAFAAELPAGAAPPAAVSRYVRAVLAAGRAAG